MTSGQQYISKGFYKYPQISDFVSVKEFIFVRVRGKKCLMLRFSNELGYVVNEMSFTLVQLDAAGNVLEKTKVDYSNLSFVPGTVYVTSEAVIVNEYCTDFRIQFTTLISENYKYTVRNGRYTIEYIKEDAAITEGGKRTAPITEYTVSPRKFGKPKLAAFMATLVAFVLLALCVLGVYSDYKGYVDDKREEQKNEETLSASEACAECDESGLAFEKYIS